MDPQLERWIADTLKAAYPYYDAVGNREQAADQRTDTIVRAIQDSAKKQAEALERGLREIADALRDIRR